MIKKYLIPECELLDLTGRFLVLCASGDPQGNIDDLNEDDLGIGWEEF